MSGAPDPRPSRLKTHCKHGHSLDDAYLSADGKTRHCRTCKRARSIAAKKKHVGVCPRCGKERPVWTPKRLDSLCFDCARFMKRDSDTKDVTCPCGKVFKSNVGGKRKFCSRACQRQYGGYDAYHTKTAIPKTDKSHIRGWNLQGKGEHCCRNCGSVKRVQLHHIIPRGKCPAAKSDLRNGVPLCLDCHWGWHGHTMVIYRDIFTPEEWDFLSSVELTGQRIEAWLDGNYPERGFSEQTHAKFLRIMRVGESNLEKKSVREASNARWHLKKVREDYMARTGHDPYIEKVRG